MASARLRAYDVINSFRNDSRYSLELYWPWKKYDIIVFQKKFDDKAFELAQNLKMNGTLIVLDINVNYYDVSALSEKERYKHNQIIAFTKISDGVITSTVYLRDYIKKLFPGRKVSYIPENITNDFFRHRKKTKYENDQPNLMYVGYAVKAKEILNIKSILQKLTKKHAFRLILICEKDPRIFISGVKIKFIKYRQKKIWRQMLIGDVFIAPRDLNNSYNLGHSFTKIGYPMSVGLPVIASQIPSYNGSPAIICHNESDWDKNLNKLINDTRLRSALGKKGIDYCRKEFCSAAVKQKYEDFFSSFFAKNAQASKVKIVINTNYESAGTKVCVDDMIPRLKKAGYFVVRNDWNNYDQYDVALFMAPDSQVIRAKEQNPDIISGIMDPKIKTPRRTRRENAKEMSMADFLLVSSIEQREYFLKFNRNIIIYYMFPDIKLVEKEHAKKEKIIIGYHGNKVHLNCLYPKITRALENIGKNYPIEFWAMYNIKKLGKWTFGVPKNIVTRHIQWSEENYYKVLTKVDIGIVNDEIPINSKIGRLITRFISVDLFNLKSCHSSDYIIRYKCSSNPGRIYVFSQLGIPVVSDFTPSACQVIQDGKSGFLVHSTKGWYEAIKTLVINPGLRNKMSTNLRNYVSNNISIDKNFSKFKVFLEIYLAQRKK